LTGKAPYKSCANLIPRSARDANGAPSGTDLSPGRYIVIENAREFTLVPWRPMLEHELGREVSGIARGRTISWSFGREHDLSL
jgi:hypothetical protein